MITWLPSETSIGASGSITHDGGFNSTLCNPLVPPHHSTVLTPFFHRRRLTTDPKTKMKYVVTEFMEESLHELIHNSTVALDENILVSIVKNIAVGMNYLHSMEPPVLHGTLRAVNVLVDLNFTAKVHPRAAHLQNTRNRNKEAQGVAAAIRAIGVVARQSKVIRDQCRL